MPDSALPSFRLSAGTFIAQAQRTQQERVMPESPGIAVTACTRCERPLCSPAPA